jgi:GNAT superfamily N-acetyltransferase
MAMLLMAAAIPGTMDGCGQLCAMEYNFGVPASFHCRGTCTLCLGDIISAKERKTLPLLPNSPPEQCSNISGSVGFLTYGLIDKLFVVYLIGVEPEHEGEGYARKMLGWTERAARHLNCKGIIVDDVINSNLKDMLWPREYYRTDSAWVKPLKRTP